MVSDDLYDKFNKISSENSDGKYSETNRYYGKLKNIQEAFPDIVFSSFLAYAILNEEPYKIVITIDDCTYNSMYEDQEIRILEGYEDENTDKVFGSLLGNDIFIKKSWIKEVEIKKEKSWYLGEVKPTKENIKNIYKKYNENMVRIKNRIKRRKSK